jgi:hypothetical protein
MRSLVATCVLLLASTALAGSPPALKVRLECFDAWKGSSLRDRAGGPGGANWNADTMVCQARLEEAPLPLIRSVQYRLEIGQGKALTLVGELHGPAHPREMLSMGDEKPEVAAIAAVAERTHHFFIPAHVFMRTLRKSSRQPETGADVYRVRFVLTARGSDEKGRSIATARDELTAEFAFGE